MVEVSGTIQKLVGSITRDIVLLSPGLIVNVDLTLINYMTGEPNTNWQHR